jgi:DNA-binding response OmpR family regulator
VPEIPALLYVEDEDAAAFLLETALQEHNLKIQLFRVCDGEQALAFLNKAGPYAKAPTPQLILLDLNLPRLNGFQLLEHLRNSNIPVVPVVVFTSSSLLTDKVRSLSLGAQEFITKPSNLDDFFQSVYRACSRLIPG